MLALIRGLLMVVLLFAVFIGTLLLCLVRPFHRDNVAVVARWFARASCVVGLKIERRGLAHLSEQQPMVLVANHQNNFDLFTHASMVPKGTVSIGKKSLKWIPFFGQIYWLTGNILIDRANASKARSTIENTTKSIRDKGLSVWIFPEGTRSYGRGLLPFKTGAFHTAINAGVPIVPVVASCQQELRFGRWHNGTIIVEALAPISTAGMTSADVRQLAQQVHQQMADHFDKISAEAQQLNAAKAA